MVGKIYIPYSHSSVVSNTDRDWGGGEGKGGEGCSNGPLHSCEKELNIDSRFPQQVRAGIIHRGKRKGGSYCEKNNIRTKA